MAVRFKLVRMCCLDNDLLHCSRVKSTGGYGLTHDFIPVPEIWLNCMYISDIFIFTIVAKHLIAVICKGKMSVSWVPFPTYPL